MAEVGVEVDAGVGAECSGPGETPEVEAEPERSSTGAPVWRRARREEAGGWAELGWAAGKEMGRGEKMGWVVLGLDPLSISISFSFANSHKLV